MLEFNGSSLFYGVISHGTNLLSTNNVDNSSRAFLDTLSTTNAPITDFNPQINTVNSTSSIVASSTLLSDNSSTNDATTHFPFVWISVLALVL